MGTPQAAVPSLARCLSDGHEIAAVYTQPDRPSGRGNKIAFSPIKEFALKHGIEVVQPLKIRTDEAIEQFRDFAADIAVVVAYGRILPKTFLEAFRFGAVNVHFSLLPKYRGAAPVNWAIVNGEKETGVTTMRMDECLDTGDILMQASTDIGADESAPELMLRLSDLGADLLCKTLSDIHIIEPKKQDHNKATLAPIMKREDGLIDWNLDAGVISNRVRGFQPFPASFTIYRGAKVTIWKASPHEFGEIEASVPGSIIASHGSELIVATGERSAVRIDEIQPEGKRRIPVRDFINGSKPVVGEVFGT